MNLKRLSSQKKNKQASGKKNLRCSNLSWKNNAWTILSCASRCPMRLRRKSKMLNRIILKNWTRLRRFIKSRRSQLSNQTKRLSPTCKLTCKCSNKQISKLKWTERNRIKIKSLKQITCKKNFKSSNLSWKNNVWTILTCESRFLTLFRKKRRKSKMLNRIISKNWTRLRRFIKSRRSQLSNQTKRLSRTCRCSKPIISKLQ